MSHAQHIGIFENDHDLLDAARECRDRNLEIVDAFTPFPIHGIDEIVGIKPTRLPIVCFLAGLTGLSLGLWFQYWSSAVDWPINVGGKPFDSLPAFVPVIFEMMVLIAGLGTAFALFMRTRLYPGKQPRVSVERVMDDRFALVVRARNAAILPTEIEELWTRHHAVDMKTQWEEDPHAA